MVFISFEILTWKSEVIFHVTNNMGHLTGMSRNLMVFAAFSKRINQNNHKLVFSTFCIALVL